MRYGHSYAARVGRKLHRLACEAIGVDNVSYRRVHGRRDLIALGSRYGGWIVPETLLGPESVCYCAGCGEDISFDLELIRRFGCVVHAFDPTPRAAAHVVQAAGAEARYHFHPIGLWDADQVLRFYAPRDPTHVSHSAVNLQGTSSYFEARARPLEAIRRELGHAHVDLLKLDIEGAEYRVLDSLAAAGLWPRILCIEFDEYFSPLDAGAPQRIRAAIDGLIYEGYRLVASQGNANYTFVREVAPASSQLEV